MAVTFDDNFDNKFYEHMLDYYRNADIDELFGGNTDLTYDEKFKTLCTNIFATAIANKYKGKPIEEIQARIACEMINYLSWYLLRESYCMVYPVIKSQVARKDYQCFLSRNDIRKGSYYYRYTPLIVATEYPENPRSYKTFKLSEIIICHEVMGQYLPESIRELDSMAYYANYPEAKEKLAVDYEHFHNVLKHPLSLVPIKNPLKRS